jgi:cytochrome c553
VPACAACHGKALTGVEPNVPGLLGLSRDYLNAQLGAWRTGQRRALAPDCMAEIARRLTPEDLSAVTAFLAAESLPKNPHAVSATIPAPPRKGRKAVQPAAAAEPPAMHCGSAQRPVAGVAR